MRISVRNGLRMINNSTHYFSRGTKNTQLAEERVSEVPALLPLLCSENKRKKEQNFLQTLFFSRRSLKIKKPSLQASKDKLLWTNQTPLSLRATVRQKTVSPQLRTRPVLLNRKENSALESWCRHNVCSSHLYLSRRRHTKEKRSKLPQTSMCRLTMYRNVNLFPFQPMEVHIFFWKNASLLTIEDWF